MRPLLVAVAALVLAGCGASHRPTVTGCLNDAGFLVSGSGSRIDGTTSDGIGFTLTLYETPRAARRAAARMPAATIAVTGRGVVDWRGNPAPSGRPSRAQLDAIGRCVARPTS